MNPDTDKHCEMCKFWKKMKKYNLGDCSCDKFRTGYYLKFEDIQSDEILIEDDEGWGFHTGGNFGCIHHERKTL